jgi:hypothetical protein
MFHLLSPYADTLHVPLTKLKRQFEEEYEVDIDSVDVNDVLPPTEEELEMAFKTLAIFAELKGRRVDIDSVNVDDGLPHSEKLAMVFEDTEVFERSTYAPGQTPELTRTLEGESQEAIESVERELEIARRPAQTQTDVQSTTFLIILILCCALLAKAIV